MQMPHRIHLILIPAVALAFLTACNGDGSSTAGIRVAAQTTHLTADTANGDPDGVTDPSEQESSIKTLYRSDNMYIELQLGLVNLRAVELLPCSSVLASVAGGLLDFLFPAAYAHADHIPSGPAGVIDVLKPDLLVWDLGQLAARPGDYCGLKIEIAPVAGHSHSDAGGADMDGKAALVSPCYYPDTAGTARTPLDSETPHNCITAAYSGSALAHEVLFGTALTLNSSRRAANLMLATLYDSWFDDLDMTILETSAGEQARLAQNLLDSFYVYAIE